MYEVSICPLAVFETVTGSPVYGDDASEPYRTGRDPVFDCR